MAFTQVTVTGTYKLADGSAAEGVVRFTPGEPMRNDTVVAASPVTAALNGSGTLSVSLAATTDAATESESGEPFYLVEEILTGQPARAYYIPIPHSPSSLDLADVTPVAGGPINSQYLTVAAGDARYSGGGGGGGGGTVDADDIVDGTTNHAFTAADDTKLTALPTASELSSQLDGLDGISIIGNAGSSLAVTPGGGSGTVKTITLNSAVCTLSFNTPAVADRVYALEFVITQDATGGRLITWPASVKWPDDTPPTLSTAPAAVDRVLVTSYDQGTTWYGDLIGLGYA